MLPMRPIRGCCLVRLEDGSTGSEKLQFRPLDSPLTISLTPPPSFRKSKPTMAVGKPGEGIVSRLPALRTYFIPLIPFFPLPLRPIPSGAPAPRHLCHRFTTHQRSRTKQAFQLERDPKQDGQEARV